MPDTEPKPALGLVEFLKLLVLLYAALVPAGLWVRGEIKSGIREWVENNQIVTGRMLDARESQFKQEMSVVRAQELGPIISNIGDLNERLQRLEEESGVVIPPTPRHYTIRRAPQPTPTPTRWMWPTTPDDPSWPRRRPVN